MLMMRPDALLDHRLQHGLRARERRRQVRREHRVPVLALHAQQQLIARDAGVVHQDVEPPVPRRASRRPRRRSTAGSVTSSVTASARPPAARISSATARGVVPARRRDDRRALAPPAPCAIARPIPRDAPVTRATRPSNVPMATCLLQHTARRAVQLRRRRQRTTTPRSMRIEPISVRSHVAELDPPMAATGRPARRRSADSSGPRARRSRSSPARASRQFFDCVPGDRLDDRHATRR